MDFTPENEFYAGGNINWSSGQDDVPRPPDGIITFSKGKASKAYIEAKEKDIQEALDVVNTLEPIITEGLLEYMGEFETLKKGLIEIRGHLMRALL